MDSDDIYKYLGLFVVVVFVVYIVIKTMNFQLKMVEGFTAADATATATDKNKVPDAIKSNTDKMSDALLTTKYLQAYEDTIMDLDANMDIYILSQVLANAESISADPGSTANQLIISKLNNAKTFSDTLNHAMKTLDKK
jgi:hypothetical protein